MNRRAISRRISIPDGVTERYAAASGDDNPIHVDAVAARAAGLPGPVLHGLWSMAQVARVAQAEADADPWALTELSVRFRGAGDPVAPLTASGLIEVEGARATVRLEARQDGRTVLGDGRVELDLARSILLTEAT
jgi:acyl dehydratase